MQFSEQQKEQLQQIREAALSNMYYISKDFCGDYSARHINYIDDAFSEYADGAISIYTRDQLDYFAENQEKCEAALLSMYSAQDLGDYIQREGLIALEAHAAVCAMYEENLSNLDEDRDNIILCIVIKALLEEGAEVSSLEGEEGDESADKIFDLLSGDGDAEEIFNNLHF